MATCVVTAMLNSRAEAERAVQQLVRELRVDCAVVRATEDDAVRSGIGDGFPAALGSLLISDEDRRILAEGLRGCVLVTATVDSGDADRATDLLDAAGALDLDAQMAFRGTVMARMIIAQAARPAEKRKSGSRPAGGGLPRGAEPRPTKAETNGNQ